MKAGRVTTEQLQELSQDERDTVLFFLKGYLSTSAEFQDALTAAYAEALRGRGA